MKAGISPCRALLVSSLAIFALVVSCGPASAVLPYKITDLGTLGGSYSMAFDINASGQVTGTATTASGQYRAFLWENGMMQDLGTLGGSSSYGQGINASGQVVGWADTASGVGHAFLWANGVMQDLGTLGGSGSRAKDINTWGQVVGNATNASMYGRAFLWENGVMYNLNDLIPAGSEWLLTYAEDINDLGQIVGWGEYEGQVHAFLLTPIPEPSVMGVVGFAFLVVMRRLRRPTATDG